MLVHERDDPTQGLGTCTLISCQIGCFALAVAVAALVMYLFGALGPFQGA